MKRAQSVNANDESQQQQQQTDVKKMKTNANATHSSSSSSSLLHGLCFVLTGTFHTCSKDDLQNKIEEHGGRTVTAISGKTNRLLTGKNPGPATLQKAQEKNITIWTETEFFAFLATSTSVATTTSKTKQDTKQKQKTQTQTQQNVVNLLEFQFRPASSISTPSSSSCSSISATLKPRQNIPNNHTLLWVDKWKPARLDQVLGNRAQIQQLCVWLRSFARQQQPITHRAVLISGPPGIGKTTTASLAAKACGFHAIEMNASDVRNKATLEEEVGDMIHNRNIQSFFNIRTTTSTSTSTSTSVLIMDEVDGADGNADRGGIAQLIQFIKKSKIPIICICNDAQSPKMKSLRTYCLQLQFVPPTSSEITPFLTNIATKEGFTKMDTSVCQNLYETTRGDVRQMINCLQMWRTTSTSLTSHQITNKLNSTSYKDIDISTFECTTDFFRPYPKLSAQVLDNLTNHFFSDTGLVPFTIYENYLRGQHTKTTFSNNNNNNNNAINAMQHASEAADALSYADILGTKVAKEQDYSLSPELAILSTIAVTHPSGPVPAPNLAPFPFVLGQISHINKHNRLVQELKQVLKLHIMSPTSTELSTVYLPWLRTPLLEPLFDTKTNNIEKVIAFMDELGLTKEDWDHLMEVTDMKSIPQTYKPELLPTALKTAFTRKYNSHACTLKVARNDNKNNNSSSGAIIQSEEDIYDDDTTDNSDNNDCDDDDDDVNNTKTKKGTSSSMIKQLTIKTKSK